ncbi:hypothetical protein MMC07_005025 [Pseudocyphellaria aurata]|nr:hypothetical protein [Pseudocyphellaria aurata]
MAIVYHLVLCSWQPNLTPEKIIENSKYFLSLKEKCLHPDTHKPYIRSLTGGIDNSIENAQQGTTHGFIVEFDSVADRDYYRDKDPAFQKFASDIGADFNIVIVLDYSKNEFHAQKKPH